jgi:hypothetical protein
MPATTDLIYDFEELAIGGFRDSDGRLHQYMVQADGRAHIEVWLSSGEWTIRAIEIDTIQPNRQRGRAWLDQNEPLYSIIKHEIDQRYSDDIEAMIQREKADIFDDARIVIGTAQREAAE